MATMRPREATNPKEKRRSPGPPSPQRNVPSNGRRSPRPGTPIDKQTVADKATPTYLKPRSATPVNSPKTTKTIPPTPTATIKRVSVPKSLEKPVSVASEQRKSLTSPPKRVGSMRLPTAAPRQFNTLKPSLERIPKVSFEKVPKVANGVKTVQVTRTKSLDKKRETTTTTTTTTTTSASPTSGGSVQVKHVVLSAMRQKQEQQKQVPQKQEQQKQEPQKQERQKQEPLKQEQQKQEPQKQEQQKEENESLVHDVAPKLEDKQDIDNSTPIETHHTESPELKNDVEKVIDAHVQLEEEQAEVIVTEVVVDEGDEVTKTDEAKEALEPNSAEEAQKVHEVVEPESGEPKTLRVIKAAKDSTPRGQVTAKKEAVRSNDVIEEAKSKFLEKRKNKVLALVGAFETVMALQEPEGQQGQQPKEKDGESQQGQQPKEGETPTE